jgi:hypothetical protein
VARPSFKNQNDNTGTLNLVGSNLTYGYEATTVTYIEDGEIVGCSDIAHLDNLKTLDAARCMHFCYRASLFANQCAGDR